MSCSSRMHENPKPLEMEDDSDDMQEDCDGNSKGKSADLSLTTSHSEQQGGNKKSLMKKTLVSDHGVDEVMQIEDSVDVMMVELSPDARSDGDQFEINEGDTPGHESVCMNLDKGSPDARSVEV
jgi:hypothetical protein